MLFSVATSVGHGTWIRPTPKGMTSKLVQQLFIVGGPPIIVQNNRNWLQSHKTGGTMHRTGQPALEFRSNPLFFFNADHNRYIFRALKSSKGLTKL